MPFPARIRVEAWPAVVGRIGVGVEVDDHDIRIVGLEGNHRPHPQHAERIDREDRQHDGSAEASFPYETLPLGSPKHAAGDPHGEVGDCDSEEHGHMLAVGQEGEVIEHTHDRRQCEVAQREPEARVGHRFTRHGIHHRRGGKRTRQPEDPCGDEQPPQPLAPIQHSPPRP